MKLVFFGSGNHAFSVIEALSKEFKLTVFTIEQEENSLAKYCLENKIPCVSFSSFETAEAKEKLRKTKADIALVASFRLMLPREILDLFSKGVLNIHPSMLPKYRGATPGQSAILNGDKTTGVSIIKLDEKMDHGPILWQKEEKILKDDTSRSLYLRLFKIAADIITAVIKQYLRNEIKLVAQNDKDATYIKSLTRESGYVDVNNPPSPDVLDRIIRAYFPWPGAWTEIEKTRIKFLPERKIQVEGKKPISLKDFKNGYPQISDKTEKLF